MLKIEDLPTTREQCFWLFPMRQIALVIQVAIAKGWYRACKGMEIEPGVYSGCDGTGGDCPVCGK